MTWHVQYRNDDGDHIGRHPSPELAIEYACLLIDLGCDVYGIGTGPLTDSIGKDEIARIYGMWARAKPPSGGISNRPFAPMPAAADRPTSPSAPDAARVPPKPEDRTR
jgi:hypothetical protein